MKFTIAALSTLILSAGVTAAAAQQMQNGNMASPQSNAQDPTMTDNQAPSGQMQTGRQAADPQSGQNAASHTTAPSYRPGTAENGMGDQQNVNHADPSTQNPAQR
jgi:hypothetical protein